MASVLKLSGRMILSPSKSQMIGARLPGKRAILSLMDFISSSVSKVESSMGSLAWVILAKAQKYLGHQYPFQLLLVLEKVMILSKTPHQVQNRNN